jgi:hypothetical protein
MSFSSMTTRSGCSENFKVAALREDELNSRTCEPLDMRILSLQSAAMLRERRVSWPAAE